MSRELDPVLESAVDLPVVRPFLAIYIGFPDPVRVFTGSGTFTYDADENGIAETWIGAGEVGSIDTIAESTDGSAVGVRVQLNKIPSEFAPDIAAQATKNAAFVMYLGTFNEAFSTIDSFQLIWRGRVDTYNIVDAGESISVEVGAESRQRDQFRPSVKRFTHEWQQRRYPGDLFFQYVAQMVEIPILWAKSELKSNALTNNSF